MNKFGINEYTHKPLIKDINQKINFLPPKKKIISSFSSTNFYPKSTKIPIFLKTINNFNYDKLKNIKQNNLQIKKIQLKSSSAIFKSNDVDLVRNLNFDSISQYNNNVQLRESLVNSLRDNINENKEKKENEEIHLPELVKLAKNKSYEIIQNHKKKIKLEFSEQLQKELLHKLKKLKSECEKKKIEKDKIFLKIKQIEEQLDEIDAENHYYKEIFKKQINDISKKRKESPEKKQDLFRTKFKLNLEKKKKNNNNRGNLMEIFKVQKKENNNSCSINTNIIKDISNKNVNKNDSMKQNEKSLIINNKENIDNSSSIRNQHNIHDQKKIENFEINLLQTKRKIEYDNFQKNQDEKTTILKEDWKKLDNTLNKIDLELEDIKQKEKKIINKLMTYYKELLFKGKNVKKDGLVWIIKAIWNLGENVPMSFMPEFLDFDSIDYLFKLAYKQIEIENCNKRIIEVKKKLKKEIEKKYSNININSNNKSNDYNESINIPSMIKAKEYLKMKKDSEILEEEEKKKDLYKELVKEFQHKNIDFELINLPEVEYIKKIKKHINQIENDILELKKKEIQRIYRCFIEFEYENKFHTNIETVLCALIGIDAKNAEMNKYNMIKKEYISSLKKIRFFDHEHIRKILSK